MDCRNCSRSSWFSSFVPSQPCILSPITHHRRVISKHCSSPQVSQSFLSSLLLLLWRCREQPPDLVSIILIVFQLKRLFTLDCEQYSLLLKYIHISKWYILIYVCGTKFIWCHLFHFFFCMKTVITN